MRAAALVLALVLAGACTGEVAGGRADGPAVFAEACARCHGGTGKPSPSLVQQLGVKDLTSAEFGGRATLESVTHQIRHGSPNKIMPPFQGVLKDEQIDAVAAYVLTLHAP
jgi:mono/diheme cytochrome c family protein